MNPNLFQFIVTFTVCRVLSPHSVSLGMIMVSEICKYIIFSSLKRNQRERYRNRLSRRLRTGYPKTYISVKKRKTQNEYRTWDKGQTDFFHKMQCIPDFVSKPKVKKLSYMFIKYIPFKSDIYSENVYS
jgi:hypothetical protein